MPNNPLYLNGDWIASQEATISPLDRGFLFGDACYEVIPYYQGQPFAINEHLQRLQYSLRELHISEPNCDWHDIISSLINQSDSGIGYIYIQVSRGQQPVRDFLPNESMSPTVLIYAEDTPKQLASQAAPKNSIRVLLREDIRWSRCDIKSNNLLGTVIMKLQAQQLGFDDVIYHRHGYITEATASNVIIYAQNKLLTAPLNNTILAGITRATLQSIARTMSG